MPTWLLIIPAAALVIATICVVVNLFAARRRALRAAPPPGKTPAETKNAPAPPAAEPTPGEMGKEAFDRDAGAV